MCLLHRLDESSKSERWGESNLNSQEFTRLCEESQNKVDKCLSAAVWIKMLLP